jgi:hypothetical protein
LDLIGFYGGDANLFRYIGNDSINHTDPTGLQRGGGLQPDPTATGPHTTININPTSGQITNYQTWYPNSPDAPTQGTPPSFLPNHRYPHQWIPGERTDITGASHGGVSTPHIHGPGKLPRPAPVSAIPAPRITPRTPTRVGPGTNSFFCGPGTMSVITVVGPYLQSLITGEPVDDIVDRDPFNQLQNWLAGQLGHGGAVDDWGGGGVSGNWGDGHGGHDDWGDGGNESRIPRTPPPPKRPEGTTGGGSKWW